MKKGKKRNFSQSYDLIINLKHIDTKIVEEYISTWFTIKTEYFLGIDGNNVFNTDDPEWASLYVINGFMKREGGL